MNRDRIWSRTPAAEFGAKLPKFEVKPALAPLDNDVILPYHFLRQFLTEQFMDTISHKSKLYCIRKSAPEKQSYMTSDNILTSIGIMYLTGYMTPASRPLFWESREDTQNMFVKKAMSRNMFNEVLRYTYFVESDDFDPADAFWKVRPLFNNINSTARQLVEQPEFVCVDETMVRYFGPHPLKQCIREKPERFGWKIWCMATAAGELLACQPYAGAKTLIPDVGLGQGPNVVYGLANQYGLEDGSKVSCDNLFTTFDLLDHMTDKGWGVVGTVRQNRIIGIPIPDKKDAAKQMTRGAIKSIYDDNICLTVWRDSQPVYVASNFTGPDPPGIVS